MLASFGKVSSMMAFFSPLAQEDADGRIFAGCFGK